MLITGPTIARLLLRPRRWGHRRVTAGRYGTPGRRGKAFWVDLADVEAAEGIRFSPAQLTAAGLHLPQTEEID